MHNFYDDCAGVEIHCRSITNHWWP